MKNKFAIVFALTIGIALLTIVRSLAFTYQLDNVINYFRLINPAFFACLTLYLLSKKDNFGYSMAILYSAGPLFTAIYGLWVFGNLPATTFPDLAAHVRTIIILNSLICLSAAIVIGLSLKLYREKRPLTDKELIQWYIHFAKLWGKRIDYKSCSKKDIEKGEKAFDSSWGIYFESKRRDSLSKLMKELLHHKNNAVRTLAARHLIWTATNESLEALDQIGWKNDELGKVAKDFASLWRAGKVPQDPVVKTQPSVNNA